MAEYHIKIKGEGQLVIIQADDDEFDRDREGANLCLFRKGLLVACFKDWCYWIKE